MQDTESQNLRYQKTSRTITGQDLFNKNNFLASYDRINIQKKIILLIKDLTWIVQSCEETNKFLSKELVNKKKSFEEKAEIVLGNGQQKYMLDSAGSTQGQKFYALERKIEKQRKKYQKLLDLWFNMVNDSELKGWQSGMNSDAEQWNRSIQFVRRDLLGRDKENQKVCDQSEDLFSLLSRVFQVRILISLFTEGVYAYYYLPSLLKITIIGINQINEVDECASLILKLELKVKVPANAQNQSNLYKYLSKLKMYVKSKKMKNEEDNTASFLLKNSDPDEETPMFFGKSILNEEDEPFSIWTQFEDYYSLRDKFQDKPTADTNSSMQEKLEDFDGVIFSAYLSNVQVKVNSYIFYSPFEILDLTGFVGVSEINSAIDQWEDEIHQKIKANFSSSTRIVIKPNLINVDNRLRHARVNALPQIHIGDYDLAENLVKTQVSNSGQENYELKRGIFGWKWATKNEERVPQTNYQNLYPGDSICHFHFPLYRQPIRTLGAIYVPTVVLGIINLFVFFQDASSGGLGDRIANIATLLISFVAMIAVLQSEIKKSIFTITSILIHAMILTPLLCMIETIYLSLNSYKQKPLQSPLFWICVAITSLNFLYPTILYFIYRCFWLSKFNQQQIREEEIIFPGDAKLNQTNQVKRKLFMPVAEIPANSKIEDWEQTLMDLTQETTIRMIESQAFRQGICKVGQLLPRLAPFLSGKKGEEFKRILCPEKYLQRMGAV